MHRMCYRLFLSLGAIISSTALAGMAPEGTFTGKVVGFDQSTVFMKQGENVFNVPRSRFFWDRDLSEGQFAQISLTEPDLSAWRPTQRLSLHPVQTSKATFKKRTFAITVR